MVHRDTPRERKERERCACDHAIKGHGGPLKGPPYPACAADEESCAPSRFDRARGQPHWFKDVPTSVGYYVVKVLKP